MTMKRQPTLQIQKTKWFGVYNGQNKVTLQWLKGRSYFWDIQDFTKKTAS